MDLQIKKVHLNFGLAILRHAETANKPFLHLHKRVFAFSMVFILDGCSFHVAHVWYINKVFFRKKIGFDDSFDVTKSKCLIYSMCAHSEMSNHLF